MSVTLTSGRLRRGGEVAQRLDLGGDAVAQHVEVGHRVGGGVDAEDDVAVVGEDRHADGVLRRERDERQDLAQPRAERVERQSAGRARS